MSSSTLNAAAEPPVNFSWIVKNQLAAMGFPRSKENVRYVVKQGIRHLVTLSPEKIPPVQHFSELAWTLLDVEEFEPPTLEAMVDFIEICTEHRAKNQSVGVHCRQGLGRTGVMAAIYLVHFQGLKAEEAMETIRRQRPWSIETYEQEQAVVQYYIHLKASEKRKK